ncbi:MAG: porin [Motiliproteus sp.]
MKKSLIALAVAGALTAPMIAQADALLYGSLRLKYNQADEMAGAGADKNTLGLGDNASRIGIRGKQQTGIDGVTATYRGEWKVISGDTGDFGAGRLAYVGLNTDAGNFNIGRMWTPAFLMVGAMTDLLDGNGSAPSQDYAPGRSGRQANATSYTTPKMGGFQAALLIQTDNDNDAAAVVETPASIAAAVTAKQDDETIDMYNLAATYEVAGFRLAGSHTANEITDKDITQVAASYTMDALYVAALISDNENRKSGFEDTFEVIASYNLGTATVFANYVDYDDGGNHVAAEVQYRLGKKARVFANYISYDDDAEKIIGTDAVSFGYRVDF